MFVFILSKDEVMGNKVKAELQEVLGQIGAICFRQIDPEATQVPHVKGDSVSIFPDKDERIKLENAIKGKVFSIKVHVVNEAKIVPTDPDAVLATLFTLGKDKV